MNRSKLIDIAIYAGLAVALAFIAGAALIDWCRLAN